MMSAIYYDISLLTENDVYLFNEGTHFRMYEKFGSHLLDYNGIKGTYFAVWAPDAESVCVMGDFNAWNRESHPLNQKNSSGIWEGFIPDVEKGARYKYRINSRYNGYIVEKADPFSYLSETPPKTASVIWDLYYSWADEEWMSNRVNINNNKAPISIYEVHIGSWMRVPEEGNRFLSYEELGIKLVKYVKDMGFTHVELLPLMEHPFYGSWGYQISNFFAPTSRYGNPQELMLLIDLLHQSGIGVILDWVPSHFPDDEHGLGYFDGTFLFEHSEKSQRIHPDWNSLIFNYGRHEVQSFLISNALFWLDKYHADGLRVDAVASMLYLDYGRKEDNWVPNRYGGNENLEAIHFLKRLNEEVYRNYPHVITIAEESTSWPLVSKPTSAGGLGFGMKWDMGWMHDTLEYMSEDPIHRKYSHNKLTFRMLYAFNENFVLPLSHDEVVHGKGSLIRNMPGDEWQKFANLRLLYGYMYAQSGKKMLFMGNEFGQWNEWYHEASLDWNLLEFPLHIGVQQWVRDLNNLYKKEPALHLLDCEPEGFEWIDCGDTQQSIISLMRKGDSDNDLIVIVCNFTPVLRNNLQVGVNRPGSWREILNSDAADYCGSGQGNLGLVKAVKESVNGKPYSMSVTLPPLAVVYFKADKN